MWQYMLMNLVLTIWFVFLYIGCSLPINSCVWSQYLFVWCTTNITIRGLTMSTLSIFKITVASHASLMWLSTSTRVAIYLNIQWGIFIFIWFLLTSVWLLSHKYTLLTPYVYAWNKESSQQIKLSVRGIPVAGFANISTCIFPICLNANILLMHIFNEKSPLNNEPYSHTCLWANDGNTQHYK